MRNRSMKKIPLKVIGFFQPVPSEKLCYVVLREEPGVRKIIVRIGIYETDAIIMAMDNIKTGVPFIHDLFFNLAQMANVKIKEILIDGYDNEKFISHIYFEIEKHVIKAPVRICDTIALAVRFESPIFIHEEVLTEQSIQKISDKKITTKKKEVLPITSEIHKLDYDQLKDLLQ